MGHPVMAAVLSSAIREVQSSIEKLNFDIFYISAACCLPWQTVRACQVCCQLKVVHNKTTGLMLSHKYDMVHKPTVSSFCQFVL